MLILYIQSNSPRGVITNNPSGLNQMMPQIQTNQEFVGVNLLQQRRLTSSNIRELNRIGGGRGVVAGLEKSVASANIAGNVSLVTNK